MLVLSIQINLNPRFLHFIQFIVVYPTRLDLGSVSTEKEQHTRNLYSLNWSMSVNCQVITDKYLFLQQQKLILYYQLASIRLTSWVLIPYSRNRPNMLCALWYPDAKCSTKNKVRSRDERFRLSVLPQLQPSPKFSVLFLMNYMDWPRP